MTSTSGRPASVAALRQVVEAELALRPRLALVLLLLVALAMSSVVAALWLTEPTLPARTQTAFGVLLVIGFSWVGFATWALTHRRILFARQQIVAGRMAVTFTAVFLLGALLMAVQSGERGPYAAAGLGLLMLAGAVAVLARAHRRFDRLVARRRALELELGG